MQKHLIAPPNVVVRASTSGKGSDENHRIFLKEGLAPVVHAKFFLFLDCWKIQTGIDKFRAVFPDQKIQLLNFPEGSTDHIQPQDLSLFRSCKFIHQKIEHYTYINPTEINMSDRQYFINMQSVIHNELPAPSFKKPIKSGFINAGIIHDTIEEVEKSRRISWAWNRRFRNRIRFQ
ncbi:unnamed protein product, partial [Rotaria sp. Silwood2]